MYLYVYNFVCGELLNFSTRLFDQFHAVKVKLNV